MGRKNEATILQELLFRKVKIRENGRLRSISLLEAIYRRAADDALKGNLKAAIFLLSRYFASLKDDPSVPSALSEDDEAVLKTYARQVLAGLPNGGDK